MRPAGQLRADDFCSDGSSSQAPCAIGTMPVCTDEGESNWLKRGRFLSQSLAIERTKILPRMGGGPRSSSSSRAAIVSVLPERRLANHPAPEMAQGSRASLAARDAV